MGKLVDVFFAVAIAIAVVMGAVCLMLLPEYQPPDWVGYAAIASVAVLTGAGFALNIYASVRGT